MIWIDTKAGHGGGKPTAKIIEEQADIAAFMHGAVGLTWTDWLTRFLTGNYFLLFFCKRLLQKLLGQCKSENLATLRFPFIHTTKLSTLIPAYRVFFSFHFCRSLSIIVGQLSRSWWLGRFFTPVCTKMVCNSLSQFLSCRCNVILSSSFDAISWY